MGRNWFKEVVIEGKEDPMLKTEFMRLYVKLGKLMVPAAQVRPLMANVDFT